MNILLIEDDPKTADFIAKGFGQSGFTVTAVNNGTDGLAKLASENFDIAVVDVMLPDIDGISLVQQARQAGCTSPVIFLSAKGSVEDKILGLQAGGAFLGDGTSPCCTRCRSTPWAATGYSYSITCSTASGRRASTCLPMQKY